jgi:hypothetical protein
MIEKFRQLSLKIKLMIAFVIILILGIILRRDDIIHEATQAFNFFSHEKDTVETNVRQK